MPEYFPSVDFETECVQNASCNLSIIHFMQGEMFCNNNVILSCLDMGWTLCFLSFLSFTIKEEYFYLHRLPMDNLWNCTV